MSRLHIALLSDVHGNYPALLAVLKDVDRRGGADAFWLLGDVTGYGPQPWDCLQRLYDVLGADQPWLAGNHDIATALLENPARADDPLVHDLVGGSNHGPAFKVVWWHALELISFRAEPAYRRMSEAVTWAMPLPGVAIAHGTALAPTQSPKNVIGDRSYVKTYDRARSAIHYLESAVGQPCHLLCVGHTHVARVMRSPDASMDVWQEQRPPRTGLPDEPEEVRVELSARDGRAVVCPGSIGQPRDARLNEPDPRAAYAVLEMEGDRWSVLFRRVPYGVKTVQGMMGRNGYPKGFIDRLSLGQ